MKQATVDERLQLPVAAFVSVLGLLSYLFFAPVFLLFGLPQIAVVNLWITVGFAGALWIQRRGWMATAVGYGAAVVVCHGWYVTLLLGWGPGFHYQILLGALVQALVSPLRLSARLVTSLVCAGAYIALAVVALDWQTDALLPWQQHVFAVMNVATFAVVLALVGLHYSEQVYRSRRAERAAQEALTHALGESRAIVDHMADGLLAVDGTGAVRAMNGSLERLLGGTDIPDALMALTCDALARQEILRAEVPLGPDRVGAAVASPLVGTTGAVALVRDITREREIDRMKTDFTAVVSHELRTPLTSILGFTRMIQNRLETRILPAASTDDPKTERAVKQIRENLDVILIEGRRLSKLIGDVLDIAKMESGRMAFASEPVDVATLVHQAEAASAGLFVDREVQLVVDVAEGLPRVLGDADRLQQVLVNLVSNASKFTVSGEVRIEARTGEGAIELRVVDTGPGIPDSEQEAIFDRFHQVGGGLADRPRGTGLGLPICRHIVASHGGTIRVQSALGEGTTMVITLPAA